MTCCFQTSKKFTNKSLRYTEISNNLLKFLWVCFHTVWPLHSYINNTIYGYLYPKSPSLWRLQIFPFNEILYLYECNIWWVWHYYLESLKYVLLKLNHLILISWFFAILNLPILIWLRKINVFTPTWRKLNL